MGVGWRVVLKGAAFRNGPPCCWDPRRTSSVQRGGLSRCLISGDAAGKACLLAPASSETTERNLLCLHQSGNGMQECWFHVPDPTLLPAFTYLSPIPRVPACWMPSPCWVLGGMRHGPLPRPAYPQWHPLKQDGRPVLEDLGSHHQSLAPLVAERQSMAVHPSQG